MKKSLLFLLLAGTLMSCSEYNNLLKSSDLNYKYEAAKQCYIAGHYSQCYQLLEPMLLTLKGTDKAEESLVMMGLCHFNLNDYETATVYLDRYVKTYPRGTYGELARYYSGRASYLESPDPRLDQTATYTAISSLQQFLEVYPYSDRRTDVNDMIFQLQDRLVEKEYESARLYYNLGTYTGNCMNGGSNYEACIVTAENALKSYPYTNLREDLYWLILRSRYHLAVNSVETKAEERFRQTIDEYYGFKNEFPDSPYMAEANKIFTQSNNRLNKVESKEADKEIKKMEKELEKSTKSDAKDKQG